MIRDQFTKILKVVLTFKDLISSTIAAEPIAATAWSGVAFALQVRSFLLFLELNFLHVISKATVASFPTS